MNAPALEITGKATQQQIALVKFADDAEATGVKTSLYYRLYPQIIAARAAAAKAEGAQ